MKTSNSTRLIVTALVGCAVAAFAAPAIGQSDDQIVIRDGSDAVPFVADVSKASAASLRDPVIRDGSAAVPFVADLDPEAPAAAEGFDWGAAWAAAGLGIATLLLVLAAARALQGARRRLAD